MVDSKTIFQHMNCHKITQLIIIGLVLFASSCRYPEIKKLAPEVNSVKKGDKFRVTLPEDHKKGETWQIKKDDNYQKFEDLGSVWHGAEKGVDFNLKSLSSGQYTITVIKYTFQDSTDLKQYIVNTQ